jgi:hypothetical protein
MTQSFEVPSKKKPYQSPKLLIYGNLTQMTRSHGTIGKVDKGGKGIYRRTG